MSYEREKEVSIEAATAAAKLCEQVRRERASAAVEKNDGTPVTVADFASQAVICRAIALAFPTDPVVGEEEGTILQEPDMADRLEQVTAYVRRIVPDATPKSVISWINRAMGEVGPRYWTLDPIDGTKGFLRGDQYTVAVALVEEGKVRVGIMACPSLLLKPEDPAGERGVLFVAVRGQGATISSLYGGRLSPIRVAEQEHFDHLPFVESVESAHSHHSRQDEVAKAVGVKVHPLRMDGQAKYGAVARGEAVLYLRLPLSRSKEYMEKIWDHAAGSIIVEEAGGRVTDMHGRPLEFFQGPQLLNNQGIIASNGVIHERVLEALRKGRC